MGRKTLLTLLADTPETLVRGGAGMERRERESGGVCRAGQRCCSTILQRPSRSPPSEPPAEGSG